ncbi:MAG: hypothetical protein U1F42_03620 [Candidatus Competibacteraceae bacterium]
MRTGLSLAGITLCSLLLAPVAYADRYDRDDWNTGDGPRGEHHHHHRWHEIERLRADLNREYARLRRAQQEYEEARRVGDWGMARHQRAEIDRIREHIRYEEYRLKQYYADRRHDWQDGRRWD